MKLSLSYIPILLLLIFHSACKNEAEEELKLEPKTIDNPIHLSQMNSIRFFRGLSTYSSTDTSAFISEYNLQDDSSLYMCIYLPSPLSHILHELDTSLSVNELVKQGNFSFIYYLDNQLIYKEDLNLGAGSPYFKNNYIRVVQPLASKQEEDSWGRYMWLRFMRNGGMSALKSDSHELRVEVASYLKTDPIRRGKTIASGKLLLKRSELEVDENLTRLSSILPSSYFTNKKIEFDTDKMESLKRDILNGTFRNISSVLVVKDKTIAIEEYFGNTTMDSIHDTRSVGKSFASTAVGIAIKNDHLDSEEQKLSEFYSLKEYKNYDPKKEEVSIEDLLTMSSAFAGSDLDMDSPGNEEYMYPSDDWVQFALDLKMDPDKENGKQWDYFTAGVVVLGDILNSKLDGGLEKYLDEHLFKPLAISNYQWQYTPQGVANTAGGLQLSSRSLAKYGQLYLNEGMWNEERVLSSEWVNESLSRKLSLPEEGSGHYGRLFWNMTYSYPDQEIDSYFCMGNGGNVLHIIKDLDLIIIITATAYNKAFAGPQADIIVKDYIIPAFI